MAKQTSIIFPYRQPPAGGQPKLPGCRAWRIIPIAAAEVAATQSIITAVPALVPTAPTGCLDGVFPVWVKTTFPDTGQDQPGIRFVNGDGWNIDAQGANWRIEYVNGGSAAADQFAYAVETTDDLNEAGQVNTPGVADSRSAAPFAPMTGGPNAVLDSGIITVPRGVNGIDIMSEDAATSGAHSHLAAVFGVTADSYQYPLVASGIALGAAGPVDKFLFSTFYPWYRDTSYPTVYNRWTAPGGSQTQLNATRRGLPARIRVLVTLGGSGFTTATVRGAWFG